MASAYTISPVASPLSLWCLALHIALANCALISAAVVNGISVGDFNLHIYAPTGKGEFPVVFFVPGFDGDAPVSSYSEFLELLVAKGFIIVGADHLAFPNYPKAGRDFLEVLQWAEAGNLEVEMRKQNVFAIPTVKEKSVVMGQSEGNHVVGQALAYGCSVAKAFVLIDPVDGFDPYRIVKSQDLIKPGEHVNFSIPALLLDNGLDEKPNSFLTPPCMPPAMGTRRWIDAWRGPLWRINATAYGHIDCLNDVSRSVGKLVCPSNSKTDKVAYRAMLANSIGSFLRGLLFGEHDAFNRLENATLFAISVIVELHLKGLNHSQIKPGCTNLNVVPELIV